uniref:UspA domain-containing protein n=1 Tax=Fagus sylvatica TaxID=28930 RepID=A0A2N9HCK5_FAGSY
MDVSKIVVVVEDVDAARTALQWALHNLVRYGDIITLLHVFPSTRSKSKKKARLLRLNGFQLALSFKDVCNNFPNTKVEIVVTEGDQEGAKIAAMVREIGASSLVVGLHDQSFLFKLAMAHENIANNLNCRVFAIKQPPLSPLRTKSNVVTVLDSSTNMDFSQIEIAGLQ